MRPIVLHGHQRSVTRVRFSNTGEILFTCSKDGIPTVWNSETGDRLGTYEGPDAHQGAVWDVSPNYNSTLLATAGADQKAKIWDLRTGECVATLEHKKPVRCVSFSHGDSVLMTVDDQAYGLNSALHFFHLPAGGKPDVFRNTKTNFNPYLTHESAEKINCALWGPTNDFTYFCTDDGSIVLYNLQSQVEQMFQTPHKQQIKRMCFSKDYTTILTASHDHTGKLLDTKTLREIKCYESDKPVNDCAFNPINNHILLAGGVDAQSVTNTSSKVRYETRFYHKIFQTELGSISGHFGPINAISVSADGRIFVTGGEDGFVRLHHFDQEYFEYNSELD